MQSLDTLGPLERLESVSHESGISSNRSRTQSVAAYQGFYFLSHEAPL